MNYGDEWASVDGVTRAPFGRPFGFPFGDPFGVGVGPSVPQGLNPCDTWQAKVQGGSAGSYPVMPPGYQLITATDLGGGSMVLSGIYQGATPPKIDAFVDAAGGPAWTITSFTPAANPSLTWQSNQQQCAPTIGFNAAGGGTTATPPVTAKPPVIAPTPIKAPAPVTTTGSSASSSSSTNYTPWIVAGVGVAGVVAWMLLK